MNKPILAIFLLVLAVAGCAPSVESTSSDFTNSGAEFKANVSTIYSVTTTSDGPGFDFQWKDSTGTIHTFSTETYKAGKASVVSFWKSDQDAAEAQVLSLDSIERDLHDSVRILSIDDYQSPHSFLTAYYFISSKGIKVQTISDSTQQVHIRFAGLTGKSIGVPETFVFKPNAVLAVDIRGYASVDYIDSVLRANDH